MEDSLTEQAYIEMADQFKEIMNNKNETIKELKKTLMVLYSLIRIADSNGDLDMICQARQVASESIDTYIFEEEN